MSVEVIEPEPLGEDIVEKLERVLARARAGELSSVAVAWALRSGEVGGCWSNPPSAPLLIGALDVTKARLTTALLKE